MVLLVLVELRAELILILLDQYHIIQGHAEAHRLLVNLVGADHLVDL